MQNYEHFITQRIERMRVVMATSKGARGVIVEYAIDGTGCVLLVVDYNKGGWEKEMPCCLSGTKVSDGTDGDEWKDGDGKEGAV